MHTPSPLARAYLEEWRHYRRRRGWLLLLCLLALIAFSAGCSERLTPSRAGTIIRHSKAFLSGTLESQPVFDGVSALLTGAQGGTPARQEGDSYVAEFSYHWRPDPKNRIAGNTVPMLKASVVLRRLGNSWAVDDEQSRALIPSWPQLPRDTNPFSSAGRVVP
jgi:hypothetical protein